VELLNWVWWGSKARVQCEKLIQLRLIEGWPGTNCNEIEVISLLALQL
jgi:hypothetical protein